MCIRDRGYTFDLLFAIKLYEILGTNNTFCNRVASDDDIWRFLSIRVIPDIVHSRWGMNETRYITCLLYTSLTVCLKNKSRLENLIRWLYSDENKSRQLKILVIDDEADQASINTCLLYTSYTIKMGKDWQSLIMFFDLLSIALLFIQNWIIDSWNYSSVTSTKKQVSWIIISYVIPYAYFLGKLLYFFANQNFISLSELIFIFVIVIFLIVILSFIFVPQHDSIEEWYIAKIKLVEFRCV